MKITHIIKYYLTLTQENIVGDWLKSLRDTIAKVKIVKRISRFENGNFGDVKPCREGVWEMRIDEGKGYRIYYAKVDGEVVLL